MVTVNNSDYYNNIPAGRDLNKLPNNSSAGTTVGYQYDDLQRKIVSYKKFCRSIMIKCTKKICLILIQWHISNQNIVM